MRVLTWNLWYEFGPWESRQSAIRRVIEREDPDVICLQEVFCTRTSTSTYSFAERLANELGHHSVTSDGPWFPRREPTVAGEETAMGNAIISRWPIESHGQITLPGKDDDAGYRKAVHARIATPWGSWPIVSTHLNHRFDESAVRLRQVDALADLIVEMRGDSATDLPVVVGGDFNAVPDSDEIRRLTGRTTTRHANLVLSDVWEQCGDGTGHTWRSDNRYQTDANWPNRRLDYVFVSWPRPKPMGHPRRAWLTGVEPEDVDGSSVQPSDHAAVVVDLRTE
ncbi:MAG: endonuclease [Acidimicrobiia bacterium]|nr:endonuclease [Acidimicrobiia bacterium]NDE81978.1 endonuclease [Actinomycetota bacterium]